ncbi:MAG: nitroreductase family protein [Cyanothece sp. SIO1E1]|nr:nitroreductase family protein [Cyanothece sp. SIO1E1]
MNVLNAIRKRRAVKHYDANHKISGEELQKLLSAAALAPTSFNTQNRQFVAVLDQETKNRLREAAWDQEQVRDASVAIIITGDLKAHERPERYLRDAPEAVREQLKPMIAGFYGGNEVLIKNEACRSVGLAAMNLMLAAKSIGYDSCPMIGFDPAGVSEAVGLDDDHPPLMLVVIGKAARPARPRLGLFNLDEVVSIDSFGKRSLSGAVEA